MRLNLARREAACLVNTALSEGFSDLIDGGDVTGYEPDVW